MSGEAQVDDAAVIQLIAVLGNEVSDEDAKRLLYVSGGDVNVAISLHFDGGLEGAEAFVEADSGGGQRVEASGNQDEGPAPQDYDAQDSPSSAHAPQDPNAVAGIDLSFEDEQIDGTAVSIRAGIGSLSKVVRGDAGPSDPIPHRPPILMDPSPSGLRDDDDAVLVSHQDAEVDFRSRRRSRPGTAPVSRLAGEDMRGERANCILLHARCCSCCRAFGSLTVGHPFADMRSKMEAMRCVVGNDVEDSALEHLLRLSEMDVQGAIEAYFDVGNTEGMEVLMMGQQPSNMTDSALHDDGQRREQSRGSEREAPLRRARHPLRSDDGPRRPFEDLCSMIGNNVRPDILAPLMVETEGDVSKALDFYVARYPGGATGQPSVDEARGAESYYLRPEQPVRVICNVYDLCWGQDKDGKKKKTNSGLAGMGLGVYHSGIEVYGREISFGYSDDGLTGVFEVPGKCAAGVMPNITFKEDVVMGTLNRSKFEVDHLLQRLVNKYRGDTYDLVRRNCNHFANELCVCLVGKKIPSYINRPANVGRVLLNTIQVPAMAFGKIMDGVKGAGKKKEEAGTVVVAAPSAERSMAASSASPVLRDLPTPASGTKARDQRT